LSESTPGVSSERQSIPAARPSTLLAPAKDSGQRPSQRSDPSHTKRPRTLVPPILLPNAVPEPLLGPARPTPDHRGSVSPHRLGQPFETRQPNESETTEVHVHIGRIEVTAVHEAAPERPRRSKVPGPMSLDEYLTRRREERR
jgi:hypothetical protein